MAPLREPFIVLTAAGMFLFPFQEIKRPRRGREYFNFYKRNEIKSLVTRDLSDKHRHVALSNYGKNPFLDKHPSRDFFFVLLEMYPIFPLRKTELINTKAAQRRHTTFVRLKE